MSDTPLYDEIRRRYLMVDLPDPEEPTGRHARHDDPPAQTAAEEDHSDPWVYAGDPADAPRGPA